MIKKLIILINNYKRNKMVKFCLKLGSIDKKLVLVIITTIIYFIMDIIDYNFKVSALPFFLEEFYTRAVSYIMIIIIPSIQKCRNKELKMREKNRSCKQIALDLLYIYIMYVLFFTSIIYLKLLKAKDPEDTEDYRISHYKGLCFEEALEIIFIVIVSKILLKMQLNIHHYIGLIIFVILSLVIDILCNKTIFKPDIFFIFIYILRLMIDSIYITYEKYMMDKLGYSPYAVVFSIGFMFLFAGTVFAIIHSFKGSLFYDGNKYLLESFEDYIAKNDYKKAILYTIYLIVCRFFLNILKILTVYYFSPIHTFATYIVLKIFYLVIRKDTEYKYYSIILFIFQFLGLLIFLEIIELNFWNLNKNTKRNIGKRESTENEDLLILENVNKEKESIEISPGYIVENEMNEMSLIDGEESRKTID